MKYSIILILLFFLISCNNERKLGNVYTEPTLTVSNTISPNPINISEVEQGSLFDYIDSIDVIPLQTKDNCLIGNISQIQFVGSKIFVVDKYRSNKVFVFDLKGNFLYTIGNQGKAYGEYIIIGDVNITENYVDFIDSGQWKVVRYNMSGELIKEISLSKAFGVSHFVELGDNSYMLIFQTYSEEHPYRIEIRDSLFNIKETALPFLYVRDEPAGNIISDDQGNKLYYSLFNDTIFSVAEDSIKPVYKTSLYREQEVNDFLKKTEGMKQREFIMSLNSSANDIVSFYSFYVSSRYFFVQYRKRGTVFNSIVDRNTSVSKTTIGMSSNLDKNNCPFYIHGIHDDCLIAAVTFDDINQLSQDAYNEIIHKMNEANIRLWRNIKTDTDANPTICIFHIKSSL